MGEALKVFFSPGLVRRIAADILRVHSSFPSRVFIQDATRGLETLELLDRGAHIANAMAEHLPAAYPAALDILLRSLGPEHPSDELLGVGMGPFFYLPHVLFVAERGLEHFDLSMRAQYELTKRFSAESSIRPYLAKDPERAFRYLKRWASDPNAHVRRLVSEGTRLRLPWAKRVAWLDSHPERVIALLERLKDDDTTLVRRSVANNLNDLSKVHRELSLSTCAAWIDGASPERRALVEHALRSAIKRGDPGALGILGFGNKPAISVEQVRVTPTPVSVGAKASVDFVLRSLAKTTQSLLVDIMVHFVKANGRSAPKVFKLKRVTLPPRAKLPLKARISFAVHTTRRPYPGMHAIEIMVNGVAMPAGFVDVVTTPTCDP